MCLQFLDKFNRAEEEENHTETWGFSFRFSVELVSLGVHACVLSSMNELKTSCNESFFLFDKSSD